MEDISVRRLQYFLVAAEEQTITRAADRLGIAQPPLSQQIKLLEKELGAQLFVRHGRGVELTAAGEVVASEAPRLIAQLTRLRELVRSAAAGDSGYLSIGSAPVATTTILPRLLRRFSDAVPGVRTQVAEIDAATAYEALRSGRLDVAVTRTGIDSTGIRTRVLVRERALMAVPYDDPLVGQESVSLSDLRDRAFVLYSRRLGRHHFDQFVGCCRQVADFSPNVVAEASTIGSQLAAVASRAGIGFVTELTGATPVPGVAFLDVADLTMELPLVLAWADGRGSPSRERFRDVAASWVSEGGGLASEPSGVHSGKA